MSKGLPDWLILVVWRALAGEIYPHIRAIALRLAEDKTLTIRYYLDREPTEMDEESIDVVCTNIGAATGLTEIARIESECRHDMAPIGKLDYLDGFIYSRREYES